MPITVPAYFAAACTYRGECGATALGGRWGGEAGSGMTGRPGVRSWLASHGNAAANARAANGQSCLPGWAITAHLIPLALPVAHSELAAAVWLFG